MRLNVFISGPMSGLTNYNMSGFTDAHAALKKAGAELVYNQILEWLTEPERVSQLRTHENYMLTCLHELTKHEPSPDGPGLRIPKYDILVQIDGWENSSGARQEKAVAEAIGIKTMDLQTACEYIRAQKDTTS